MSYLGYVEGLARVGFGQWDNVPDSTCSHLYRGTFGEVGDPLCPKGWRKGVKGEISIFRENTGGGGLCRRCQKVADKLGPNPESQAARRYSANEESATPTEAKETGLSVAESLGGTE